MGFNVDFIQFEHDLSKIYVTIIEKNEELISSYFEINIDEFDFNKNEEYLKCWAEGYFTGEYDSETEYNPYLLKDIKFV